MPCTNQRIGLATCKSGLPKTHSVTFASAIAAETAKAGTESPVNIMDHPTQPEIAVHTRAMVGSAIATEGEATMSIDWDKLVQTRDGREVRIYTRAGQNSIYPVVGEVSCSVSWTVVRWTIEGRYVKNETDNNDLVNIPQQHTYAANFYKPAPGSKRATIYLFNNRSDANEAATDSRIACIDVTFTEGEGLE